MTLALTLTLTQTSGWFVSQNEVPKDQVKDYSKYVAKKDEMWLDKIEAKAKASLAGCRREPASAQNIIVNACALPRTSAGNLCTALHCITITMPVFPVALHPLNTCKSLRLSHRLASTRRWSPSRRTLAQLLRPRAPITTSAATATLVSLNTAASAQCRLGGTRN